MFQFQRKKKAHFLPVVASQCWISGSGVGVGRGGFPVAGASDAVTVAMAAVRPSGKHFPSVSLTLCRISRLIVVWILFSCFKDKNSTEGIVAPGGLRFRIPALCKLAFPTWLDQSGPLAEYSLGL